MATKNHLMNILVIGDVVGTPGRRVIQSSLESLRSELDIDLVVANGENAAHGRGITVGLLEQMLNSGVDVVTTGNHVWDQREFLPHLDSDYPIIRPINYPDGVPGRGYLIAQDVLIVNAMGRTFMPSVDCPFRAMDKLLSTFSTLPRTILVDFHAEATSEKVAMGWYLDGRVTAVVGTHTHVPTADAKMLPMGTAFVTDIGMTGPCNSIIGNEVDAVLSRFLTSMPTPLPVAEGPALLNAMVIEVDDKSGRARSIRRIERSERE